VDGQPVGTSVRVPIVYTIVDSSRDAGDSAWQAFVPGPYVPAPWSAVPEAEAIASIAKLGNGEVQPLDSRFKLLDGVIGSML
jgi:hypothetical protein